MNLKQFKLSNDDEIICEVIETRDDIDSEGYIVIRKVLKVMAAEDFDNNIRYYSFRPWVSFQDDPEELSILNVGHIIGETLPSKTLTVHYAAAVREVEISKKNKKEFNLDELISEMEGLDPEQIEELIDQKLREDAYKRNEDAKLENDSSKANVIQFKSPKDTMH